MPKENAHAVRIAQFRVDRVDGDWKACTSRWHALSDACTEIANAIWQVWLIWHIENGSRAKLAEWLNKRKSDGVKAAGKCPVNAVPKELSKQIYDTLSERFPNVHGRVWGLLQQIVTKGIKQRKASRGSLPGWSAILLCREGMPSFTHRLPIRFDKKNGALKIVDGKPVLELRTWRLGDKKSVCDTVHLWCKGRSVQSQVRIFQKIVSGEFEFKGSSLQYDKNRRQWHALISYQRPTHRADVDKSKVAYVYPGRKIPFLFRVPGERRRVWLQHRGHHIAAVRRRVFMARRDRQSNYRNATLRKGKGRKSYDSWRGKFDRSWRNFVKRVNHNVAHKSVQECIARGIGKLVLLRPNCDRIAGRCFVSTAGADGYTRSTWEFYQLKTMLKYKCQDAGIEFSEIEFDGSQSGSMGSAAHGEAA